MFFKRPHWLLDGGVDYRGISESRKRGWEACLSSRRQCPTDLFSLSNPVHIGAICSPAEGNWPDLPHGKVRQENSRRNQGFINNMLQPS